MSAVVSPRSRRAARAARATSFRLGGSPRWRERLRVLDVWVARWRQRRRLLALSSDPDFLRDVGLSRADAEREAGRPFWRE